MVGGTGWEGSGLGGEGVQGHVGMERATHETHVRRGGTI